MIPLIVRISEDIEVPILALTIISLILKSLILTLRFLNSENKLKINKILLLIDTAVHLVLLAGVLDILDQSKEFDTRKFLVTLEIVLLIDNLRQIEL